MKTVYVAHSKDFPFESDLYEPIRKSILSKQYHFIFPHEGGKLVNSKESITSCDIFLAELSIPGTGMGIEIGWADMLGKPILTFHQASKDPGRGISFVAKEVIPYQNVNDFIEKLTAALERFDHSK